MEKPQKTLADYLVLAICPVLIVLLVGSLAFFLIQVFYRGEMIQGLRWAMCWFVLAAVLVSRIGIQFGKAHARWYGGALALAAWIYLARTYQVPWLGAVLLGITWWCAHRLTVDCTRIPEGEDPADDGVFGRLWRALGEQLSSSPPPVNFPSPSPLELLARAELAKRRALAPRTRPGRSVFYFSIAALPLFGIGQLLLPADDPHARRLGFVFLLLYLAAAFGLLATTGFLGLRRDLRLHSVEMPPGVTAAWIRFGGLLAAGVLLLALLLPRPGVASFWKHLSYPISHKEHKASPYALRFNPPAEGEGRPVERSVTRPAPQLNSPRTPPGNGSGPAQNHQPGASNARDQSGQPGAGGGRAGGPGSGGQAGGTDGNMPSAIRNLSLKDVTPPGDADQPSDSKTPPGPTDESDGGGRDGGAGQRPKIETSQQRPQPGKEHPRTGTQQTAQAPPTNVASQKPQPQAQPAPQPQNRTQTQKQPSDVLQRLLRVMLLVVVGLILAWLVVRYRKPIAAALRAFWAAVRAFFAKLFRMRRRSRPGAPPIPMFDSFPPEPSRAYGNPFPAGKDRTWPREILLRYTYQAIQDWAREQGIEMAPPETPRQFCRQLAERFPDVGPELEQFAVYYNHVAFARRLPEDFETETIRRLWQFLDEAVQRT